METNRQRGEGSSRLKDVDIGPQIPPGIQYLEPQLQSHLQTETWRQEMVEVSESRIAAAAESGWGPIERMPRICFIAMSIVTLTESNSAGTT